MKKRRLKPADFECGPICRHKGSKLLPFLCLGRPENLACQWDTTVWASRVCVCVITHTVSQVFAVGVMAHNTSVLWGLLYFHNKPVVGVISAMGEKEFGERNFGFGSLKYMYCNMLPAAGCHEAPPPRSPNARQRAAGSRQSAVQSTSDWCGSGRTREVGEPDKVVCDS